MHQLNYACNGPCIQFKTDESGNDYIHCDTDMWNSEIFMVWLAGDKKIVGKPQSPHPVIGWVLTLGHHFAMMGSCTWFVNLMFWHASIPVLVGWFAFMIPMHVSYQIGMVPVRRYANKWSKINAERKEQEQSLVEEEVTV
mmetsp:Transcript_42577/g.76523  ORF Transcript_42577/g.76523 Transcript_42577/m.76523 type:complete len:140 (-) Transcript_42577:17-436(-)